MQALRLRVLVIGIVVALGVAGVVALGEQACREPVDVSGTTQLPGWLNALKERDELAYPAHALLGTILNEAGCSSTAAGLQWVKAGAHARTEQEVATAGRGLSVARARADRAETFDTVLCGFVANGFANPRQEAVSQEAGIRCG